MNKVIPKFKKIINRYFKIYIFKFRRIKEGGPNYQLLPQGPRVSGPV